MEVGKVAGSSKGGNGTHAESDPKGPQVADPSQPSNPRPTPAQAHKSETSHSPASTISHIGSSAEKPPLVRHARATLKPRPEKGKAVIEAEQEAKRKKQKAQDGALTWEIPPQLETPKALQRGALEGSDQSDATPDSDGHPVMQLFRQPLEAVSQQHLVSLCALLLKAHDIPEAARWTPVISFLAFKAATLLDPISITGSGCIDPRAYVKIKRLAESSPEDSCVVHGIALRKNLTHRKMRRKIENARVMLLGNAFEFFSTQGRLASFDHYTKDQETEHLRSAVDKLAELKPDVLLVEKSVAREAQEALLNCKIALALNVKRANLDRIALCTGAQVAPSLGQITADCVAVCKEFEVEETSVPSASVQEAERKEEPAKEAGLPHSQSESSALKELPKEAGAKPEEARNTTAPSPEKRGGVQALRVSKVMSSGSLVDAKAGSTGPANPKPSQDPHGKHARAGNEGPGEPGLGRSSMAGKSSKSLGARSIMYFKGCGIRLGCTLLLRGAPNDHLAAIKKILNFMVYCAYRGRLENSFLAAELASALAAEPCGSDPDPTTGQPAEYSAAQGAHAEPDQKASSTGAANAGAEESPTRKMRMGVSWHVSRTLGASSRLANPAMAALMAAGPDADTDAMPDAAQPCFLDWSKSELQSQAADTVQHAYNSLEHDSQIAALTSASPYCCKLLSNADRDSATAPKSLHGENQHQGSISELERAVAEQILPLLAAQSGAFNTEALSQCAYEVLGPMTEDKDLLRMSELEQRLEDTDPAQCKAAEEAAEAQRLQICYGKRNPGKALLCEPPKVQSVQLYQGTDAPLAAFLASNLPAAQKRCGLVGCAEGPSSHMMSYLHGKLSLSYTVAQLPEGKELPGAEHGQIWVWERPLQMGSQVDEAVRRVALPGEAACLSVGHFLELSFGMAACRVQGRALHLEHARYFGLGGIVACFHPELIAPNDILMPAKLITYSAAAHQQWLEEEAEQLIEEANRVFLSINEALSSLEERHRTQPDSAIDDAALQALRTDLGFQGASLSDDIMQLCEAVQTASGPSPHSADGSVSQAGEQQGEAIGRLTECVWRGNAIRRALAQMTQTWISRLQASASAAAPKISRSSSAEEVGGAAIAAQRHSRTASHDQVAESLDERATGLKMLAREIMAGSADSRSPTGASAEYDRGLPSPRTSAPLKPLLKISSPRLPSKLVLQPSLPSEKDDQRQGATSIVALKPAPSDPLLDAGRGGQSPGKPAPGRAPHALSRLGPAEQRSPAKAREGAIEGGTVDKGFTGLSPARSMPASDALLGRGPAGQPPSPTREALRRASNVSSRIAAFEQQAQQAAPLLRSISKPAWPRLSRQRSTTDTVLSWLNAGRPYAASPDDPEIPVTIVEDARQRDPKSGLAKTGAAPGSGSETESLTDDECANATVKGREDAPVEDVPVKRLNIRGMKSNLRASLDVQPSLMPLHSPLHDAASKSSSSANVSDAVSESPKKNLTITLPPSVSVASLERASSARLDTAKHMLSLTTRSSEPLPPSASQDKLAQQLHVLEREDSQLDSHFDVSKWGDILKTAQNEQSDASVSAAASEPGGAEKHNKSLSSAPDVSLKIPISATIQASSKAGTTVSEPSGSVLNLQLPSALTAILTSRKAEPVELPPAFGQLDGRSLLPPGPSGRNVTVRDDEPTSIVAHFLSSREHAAYVEEAAAYVLHGGAKPAGAEPSYNTRGNVTTADMPAIDALTARPVGAEQQSGHVGPTSLDFRDKTQSASSSPTKADAQVTANMPFAKGQDLDKGDSSQEWRILLATEPLHYQDAYQDDISQPAGKASIQVVAWYAPQFAELRKQCCAGGEAAFASSLSRSHTWEARGGKTRSYFAKTADDRYIVKQLQGPEKKTFQEIAPAYFRYLAGCMRHATKSCLAKIVGVYTVTVKPVGGKETQMDILVMENIFYDRELFPVYDLKGSERARLARDDPSDPTRVLMDQNLLQSNLNDPILVKQEEYAELERSLWNDTAFLSQLGVMDYSLLVGVEKSSHTLVVGIIDFIRQYTWDKALERWVKSGMGLSKDLKAPTIQSPKEYCRRFRVAMASYFTQVPSVGSAASILDTHDSSLGSQA